jgi:hypothetical protein
MYDGCMTGIGDVLHALENDSLSQALGKLEFFAKLKGDSELAAWVGREQKGGFEGLTIKEMPDYRIVTVSWLDPRGIEIFIEDPNLYLMNRLGVSEGVPELESKRGEGIRKGPPDLLEMFRKYAKLPLSSYVIRSSEIEKILTTDFLHQANKQFRTSFS